MVRPGEVFYEMFDLLVHRVIVGLNFSWNILSPICQLVDDHKDTMVAAMESDFLRLIAINYLNELHDWIESGVKLERLWSDLIIG